MAVQLTAQQTEALKTALLEKIGIENFAAGCDAPTVCEVAGA